jgi:cytoskeletal protein CcmA (bactofilin family)
MFRSRRRGTVIAEGLKIAGNVTAEGSVEVHGQIEGELRSTSLTISRQAQITGAVIADDVIVDGTVNGPIHGAHVTLKSQARVTGDIHHQSLTIERGAQFDGQSKQEKAPATAKPDKRSSRNVTPDSSLEKAAE